MLLSCDPKMVTSRQAWLPLHAEPQMIRASEKQFSIRSVFAAPDLRNRWRHLLLYLMSRITQRDERRLASQKNGAHSFVKADA